MGKRVRQLLFASDLRGPNGLCFSPDETKLYVVESRATPNRVIRVFDVINGRKLVSDRIFVDAGPGTPDGLRSDIDGNLWCGWGMGTAELDGVFIYSLEGKLIGRIHLPERCAQVCTNDPAEPGNGLLEPEKPLDRRKRMPRR
jgi:gluconolactonase